MEYKVSLTISSRTPFRRSFRERVLRARKGSPGFAFANGVFLFSIGLADQGKGRGEGGHPAGAAASYPRRKANVRIYISERTPTVTTTPMLPPPRNRRPMPPSCYTHEEAKGGG